MVQPTQYPSTDTDNISVVWCGEIYFITLRDLLPSPIAKLGEKFGGKVNLLESIFSILDKSDRRILRWNESYL